MREAARQGGGKLVLVTADDEDVRQLSNLIERSIAAAPVQQGERWKDAGYGVMVFFFVLVLPFFRRGGAVRMGT